MAQHSNLAAALAAFQAELPKLRKDETAKVRGEGKDGQPVNYQYGYADLAQVVEAVSPVLGRHGLAFTSTPTMTDHGFILEYVLLHESGEQRVGAWPLPNPTQIKPQNLGSAITYARRYALMAVTNTFPDKEDDDGAKAGEVPASYSEPTQPRQGRGGRGQKPTEPSDPGGTTKMYTDEEVIEMRGKLAALPLDQATELYQWMIRKGLHERPVDDHSNGVGAYTPREALADRLATDAATADRAGLKYLAGRAIALDLTAVKVSDTETLDQLIEGMRSIRNAEALDTENAAALRESAADSWNGLPDEARQ